MASVKATINGTSSTVTNIVDSEGTEVATLSAVVSTETKTVTPSTSKQTVTPSTGKDGLSSVTVNAVTASIDANIIASNIKKGVTILGVTGTYTGDGGSEETVTLESISAVANTTSYAVGTDASDLDLTVTGTYSDGSTAEVTRWEATGNVEKGENTFTISYSGKTCTVTVTGTAETITRINLLNPNQAVAGSWGTPDESITVDGDTLTGKYMLAIPMIYGHEYKVLCKSDAARQKISFVGCNTYRYDTFVSGDIYSKTIPDDFERTTQNTVGNMYTNVTFGLTSENANCMLLTINCAVNGVTPGVYTPSDVMIYDVTVNGDFGNTYSKFEEFIEG